MNKWILIAGVCFIASASQDAAAQGLQGSGGARAYAVSPGRTIPLGQHYSSSNCAGTGVPELKLLQEPSFGTITKAVVQTHVESTPLDASGKPRPASHMACVGKPITVLEVRYKAASKRGIDSFSYQLLYPGGITGQIDARVTVK